MKAIGTALMMALGMCVGIIVVIIKIALTLLICLGIPLILIYAIYKAVIAVIDHQDKLKRQREDEKWFKDRSSGGQ